MKFRRKARESVDINLAPLIDVVFILLLFFVVTTTFTRETQLRVELPEAVSGSPAERQASNPPSRYSEAQPSARSQAAVP